LFQSALYRSYLVLKTTFELAYNFFCYTSQLHPSWGPATLPTCQLLHPLLATNFQFESLSTSKATVSPSTASSSPETITVTSVSEGATAIEAIVNSKTNAMLGVDVCRRFTKTIKIHAVTEDDDDVQVIEPGDWSTNDVCVTVGANGTLETTPVGDDLTVGATITTGANGICDTIVSSDDVQVIPGGDKKAYSICVTAGANGFRDTVLMGDDTVSGDDITTGPDGICDTVAYSTDLAPAFDPSAADLESYLNDVWGKQANIYFSVTKSNIQVNYDLDRSNTLAHPSLGPAANPAEDNAISTAAKDTSVDFNIYYVFIRDQTIGTTNITRGETWTAANGDNTSLNHTAHEVGHLLSIPESGHSTDQSDLMYRAGISTNPTRVIKRDWDTVNPN